MRIDELEKEIKQLSDEKGIMLRVIKRDGYVCIQRLQGLWNEVALVKLSKNFAINTNNIWFEMLEEEIKEKIFDILVKFARTPTDERKEEKRYLYRLKEKYLWIDKRLNLGNSYLNIQHSNVNDRGDIVLDIAGNTNLFKAIFTDKEIEEVVKEFNVDLSMLDKIEVE